MKKLDEARGSRTLKVTRVVVNEGSHRVDQPLPRAAKTSVNPPGLAKRAENLWRDMKTVLHLFFAGEQIAESKEMILEKLKICAGDSEKGTESCEMWRSHWPHKIPGWGICAHEQCGCVIGFKARLKAQPGGKLGCPLKKWVVLPGPGTAKGGS